jgi:membrane protein YdbS with pleckstrin-like domain
LQQSVARFRYAALSPAGNLQTPAELRLVEDAAERVCLDARRHGVVLALPLAKALGLAAAGGILLTQFWALVVLGAVAIAAGALVALRAVWRWEWTRFVITTERVYLAHGSLHRRAKAVRLRAIDSVEVEQNAAGRLLGYGTVLVGPLEVEHVPEPKQVTELVERLCA